MKLRWAAGVLAAACSMLALCAAVVITVDPFFHYRAPDPEAEVWFDQRCQSAGLLRSQSYQQVLMGSSLAANFRPFWFSNLFGLPTVKVTFPNGGFSEFDTALRYAFSKQEVRQVIFGLDPNLLARSPAEAPDQLPDYLYDDELWNDGAYLLSKDVLLRTGYTLMKKAAGETQPLEDAFFWDGTVFFEREMALAGYDRPERAGETAPEDLFLDSCAENLSVVESWLTRWPQTRFIFFISPYSILFWDRMDRLGQTQAMLRLLDTATDTLLRYDNAEIYFFMADEPTITDLDNYADHIHMAGRVTYQMALDMADGTCRMDRENRRQTLDALGRLVVNYDYESIFR